MPGSETAELYFIAAMMVLILIISGVSVYFFLRQYRKEMRAKMENGKQTTASGKREVENENLKSES